MTITEKAYAKLNLYLHITGQRPDGYHDLESMVVFTGIYDVVECVPADIFSFTCEGPFSDGFSKSDLRTDRESSNLVVRAAYLLADRLEKEPTCQIKLTKNIPMQAGLGGGSADAAAVLRALCRFWGVDMESVLFADVASFSSLGADVPVCIRQHPCYMTAIGDDILDLEMMPDMGLVLVYPQLSCSTAEMFSKLQEYEPSAERFEGAFESLDDLLPYLKAQKNSFENLAAEMQPDIGRVIAELKTLPDCMMARLTGSGSACFAVFETEQRAAAAASILRTQYPEWWICATQTMSKTMS